MAETTADNPRQHFHDVYGWLSRLYAETRTHCHAYDIMRADREWLSAGEVVRKVTQYQQIRANLPDTTVVTKA
jgi:hypothetical protein